MAEFHAWAATGTVANLNSWLEAFGSPDALANARKILAAASETLEAAGAGRRRLGGDT